MSAFTFDGDLVHYEVLGRGRQVVLVHGWVGSWRYWIPTMQALQAKYRVYALDLFGFGDSGRNPAKYPIDRQVALLNEFMRELGIPKTALIGHGLGALVAAEFTRRYEEKVARLMLLSAPLFDTGDLDKRMPAPRKPVSPAIAPETGATSVSSSPTTNAPNPELALPMIKPLSIAASVPTTSAAIRIALLEAVASAPLLMLPTDPASDDETRKAGAVRPEAASAALPAPGDGKAVELASAPEKAATPSNPLAALINDAESLLGKAFRRSEPEHAKLQVDVAKTDPKALVESVGGFDAGALLDTLRQTSVPTVVMHGSDDPILPPPNEAVWGYVTTGKENLLPIPLANVRHFPMLEYDLFHRLATDFLEAPDITKLEIKERWRRRTR